VDWTATLLDALHLVLRVTAPVLLACLVAALLSSLVQAVTQAHDTSVGFVARWFAVGAALFASREFIARELLGFSTRMLHAMSQLGQ
jgi:flagellar biosynthesis protein FliQ